MAKSNKEEAKCSGIQGTRYICIVLPKKLHSKQVEYFKNVLMGIQVFLGITDFYHSYFK